MFRSMLFGAVVWILSSLPLLAAEIHVPADQSTIQAAISAAVVGDEVIVAPGTYVENIDFLGKAITVRSSDGSAVTTIDGSALTGDPGVGATVAMRNGEGPDSVLQGFTVTGGTETELGSPDFGGGFLGLNTSPTVRGCRFVANFGDWGGGMALFEVPGDALIEDCEFSSNTGFRGAGIFATGPGSVTLLGCSFLDNVSETSGGGAALGPLELVIEDCLFAGNAAENSIGGGATIGNHFNVGTIAHSVTTIRGCEFRDNTALIAGAGFHLFRTDATVEDCRVSNNSSYLAAFGIDVGNVVLDRCVIDHNDGGDGPILGTTINVSTVEMTRCTIASNTGNSVLQIQSSSSGSLNSSIVAGNTGELFVSFGQQSIPSSYSNVQSGLAGVGNIDADPLFVDAASGDFRLLPGSPCIDAGDPGVLDPDGTPIEMGALPFEELLDAFYRGDANQDGNIDIGDGIWILNELFLGGAPSLCLDASDANDDGMVDLGDAMTIFDFVLLAGAPLPAPGAECGEDPTEDVLDCSASSCP